MFAAFATAPTRGRGRGRRPARAGVPSPGATTARSRSGWGFTAARGRSAAKRYVGIDVHRVARIANAGHGGQVLVSAATRMLAESSLPDGVSLRELGEFRLKDLSRPEQLAMLVIEGLPDEFPALRTLDAVPNNLPTQLTTFLGRQRELEEAAALLEQARLLTLTGPGGTGKTRLSLQLAADATERFHDGVYFVPLGTIDEPAPGAPDHRPGARHARPGWWRARPAGRPAGRQAACCWCSTTSSRCSEAAPQIGELLARLPDARVLATSRSPLHVYGEQEYPVPPLALPDPRHLPDLETLSQFASVALFVERAMSVRPGFAVDAAECAGHRRDLRPARRAAAGHRAGRRARSGPHPAGDPVAAGRSAFACWPAAASNLPERQQTLRGAIGWSHDLLEPADRARLRPAGGLRGRRRPGRGRAGGRWPIGQPTRGPVPDALDAVASLLDKSLLRQEMAEADEPRFRMLESIRAMRPGAPRRARAGPRDAATPCRLLPGLGRGSCRPGLRRASSGLRWMRSSASTTTCGPPSPLPSSRPMPAVAMRLLAATLALLADARLPARGARQGRAHPRAGRRNARRSGCEALDAAGGIAYWQGDMLPSRDWYEQRGRAGRGARRRARRRPRRSYNESFTYSLIAGEAADARASWPRTPSSDSGAGRSQRRGQGAVGRRQQLRLPEDDVEPGQRAGRGVHRRSPASWRPLPAGLGALHARA